MAREGLVTVLGRAALDEEYLKRLQQDPRAAVAELHVDLTDEEMAALETMDFNALRTFNKTVREKEIQGVFDKKDA